MRRFFALVPFLACLLLPRLADAAGTSAPLLHIGDVFPRLSARTLTGESVTVPAAGTNMAAVLVFSFSRKAAQDAQEWNLRLSNGLAGSSPVYGIIELESAPKLFRGMAVAGIRSATPTSAQKRTIVLYRDEDVWKKRLAVSDLGRAYVVLLGSDGRIRWMSSGVYAQAQYTGLAHVLAGKFPPRP